MKKIEQRTRCMVPTAGSQRRCYDGVFHSSDWEEGWTEWDWLNINLTDEEAEKKLKFWTELNEYSVSVGGKSTQYRIVSMC